MTARAKLRASRIAVDQGPVIKEAGNVETDCSGDGGGIVAIPFTAVAIAGAAQDVPEKDGPPDGPRGKNQRIPAVDDQGPPDDFWA